MWLVPRTGDATLRLTIPFEVAGRDRATRPNCCAVTQLPPVNCWEDADPEADARGG